MKSAHGRYQQSHRNADRQNADGFFKRHEGGVRHGAERDADLNDRLQDSALRQIHPESGFRPL